MLSSSDCADCSISGYLKLEGPQQFLCRGLVTSALEVAACVSEIIVRRHRGLSGSCEAGSVSALAVLDICSNSS